MIYLFFKAKQNPPVVDVVEGNNLLPIVFELADFVPPSGCTARIFVQKPSGKTVFNDCALVGTQVTVQPTTQMFAEPGRNPAQIILFQGERMQASFPFVFAVDRNLAAGAEESRDESIIKFPIATADTVGGITAEPKTDAQTMPVGIDPETGRLYTEPSEGGSAITEATATVDNNVGIPQVDVELDGETLKFAFKNLKGENGETGPQGPPGPEGEPGPAGPQGEPGKNGADGQDGADGQPGADGKAATVTVGSVETIEPTESASVINAGTENAAILNFKIPKGAKGDTGAAGKDGAQGERGLQGEPGADGAPGEKGEPGQAATIQIGTVTTGEPGTQASVVNSGTENAAVLDFTIPRGESGGESEKPWQLFNTIEATEDTGSFEFTGLNFSEFMFIGSGLVNVSETTDSSVMISINDYQMCGLVSQKNNDANPNRTQFIHMKYNGLIWEIYLTGVSNSAGYYTTFANIQAPYSNRLDVGKCEKLNFRATVSAYRWINGTITIYAR